MKNEIVGRVREKQTLEKLRRSKEPELLALYGRRRVGKTFLIRKYFGEEETYFELTGQHRGPLHQQLENFAEAFGAAFLRGHALATPTSWNRALRTLAQEIDRRKPSEGFEICCGSSEACAASSSTSWTTAVNHLWPYIID